jgi:tetratricopeptide (TPR) repeat protein
LTESDKSATIAQARMQQTLGTAKKVCIVVRCVGCEFEIPLILSDKRAVGVLKLDPYNDVKPAAVEIDRIPAVPVALNDDDAYDRYSKGLAAFQQEDYERAYAFWRAAYGWYAGRPEGTLPAPALLSNMGMALSRLNAPERALECFHAVLRTMDPAADRGMYATVLNNIGAAYLHLGRMDQAEEYHRRAYECHLEHGSSDPALVARDRHNLAFTYAKLVTREVSSGDLEAAVRHARQAVGLFHADELRTEARAYCLMLGNVERRQGDAAAKANRTSEAIAHYREAMTIHEQAGAASEVLALDYSRLAQVQRSVGLLNEALLTLQRLDELLEEVGRRRVPLSMFKMRNRVANVLLGAARRWRTHLRDRTKRVIALVKRRRS